MAFTLAFTLPHVALLHSVTFYNISGQTWWAKCSPSCLHDPSPPLLPTPPRRFTIPLGLWAVRGSPTRRALHYTTITLHYGPWDVHYHYTMWREHERLSIRCGDLITLNISFITRWESLFTIPPLHYCLYLVAWASPLILYPCRLLPSSTVCVALPYMWAFPSFACTSLSVRYM